MLSIPDLLLEFLDILIRYYKGISVHVHTFLCIDVVKMMVLVCT